MLLRSSFLFNVIIIIIFIGGLLTSNMVAFMYINVYGLFIPAQVPLCCQNLGWSKEILSAIRIQPLTVINQARRTSGNGSFWESPSTSHALRLGNRTLPFDTQWVWGQSSSCSTRTGLTLHWNTWCSDTSYRLHTQLKRWIFYQLSDCAGFDLSAMVYVRDLEQRAELWKALCFVLFFKFKESLKRL